MFTNGQQLSPTFTNAQQWSPKDWRRTMRELEESLTLTMCLFQCSPMFREETMYSSQCCNSVNADFLVNQYNYLSENFDIYVPPLLKKRSWPADICRRVCSSAITTSSGMQQCSNVAMQHACKNNFSNDKENVSMC